MIVLLAGLAGPGQGAGQSPDEAEIRRAVTGLREAWNRHDMKAFASEFAEDADFVNVAGAWWKGRAEIEQKHAAVHATVFRESTLSIDELDIRFLTPEVAVAHVLTSLVGQKTPEGAPVPPRKALLTQVLQKRNGKWMIVASQNTDVRAAVPASAEAPKN
jgi:uncharacterized protein (TIGR02246 family)